MQIKLKNERDQLLKQLKLTTNDGQKEELRRQLIDVENRLAIIKK